MASLNPSDLDKFINVGSIKIGKENSADIIENIDTKIQYLKLRIPTFDLYDLFLKNPLFMKVVGVSHEDNNEANIILEYYPNRSLKTFLEQNETNRISTFTQTQKYILIYGIASIIQHIHINNLYHGDLNLNSIFLDEDFVPHICYFPNLSKEQTENLSFDEMNKREILDMNCFCFIAYEIMTGRKCINDDEMCFLNQDFDLSVIEENWERTFFKKCWAGYDFNLTIHDIVNEIINHKTDFGDLDEEQITKFNHKIENYQKEYSEAIKNKADSNDIKSITLYGKMLRHGYCLPVDKKQASQYFKQGSIQDDVDAKYMYGLMLLNGEGIKKNEEKASIYLKEASDQNHQGALFQYNYSIILTQKNPAEGLALIVESAKKGYLKAIETLEGIFRNLNLQLDEEFYKILLSYGDPLALTKIGTLFIKKNPEISTECFKKAIFLDFSLAMYTYGKILFEGENKEEGIHYLKMGADRKFPNSCFYYGKLLLEGKHIEQDLKEASRLIKEAADNGNEEATNYYGLMLRDGVAVEKNIPEAAKYFRLAIAGGNEGAMFNYGTLILNEKEIEGDVNDGLFYIKQSALKGFVPAKLYLLGYYSLLTLNNDNTKIIENIKQMAEEGDPESMYNYAIILSNGEEDQENKPRIAQFYQEAAEKGHVGSMNNYAFMLKNGDGIQQNKPEAEKYFRMAADNGHIISMYQLAIMLIEGDGIPENKNEGLMFMINAADQGYEEAELYIKMKIKHKAPSKEEEEEILESESFFLMRDAENGDIEAMFKLGIKLLYGQGIYRSRPDAAEYFKKAAELGHVGAMNRYGEMLHKGDGIPKDVEKAAQLLKQASDKGHIIAMFNYAVMLSEGEGVTKNKLESAKYFKAAADQWHIQSAKKYGVMLYNGDEIPKNQKVSLKYLQKATKGFDLLHKYNYGVAKMSLNSGNDASEPISYIKQSADEGLTCARKQYADFLYGGIGVPINKKEASRYYKLAADDGNISSLYKYAEMVEKGDGIDMDVEEAMKYYRKAFLTNDKEATIKIRRLNKFFSYSA